MCWVDSAYLAAIIISCDFKSDGITRHLLKYICRIDDVWIQFNKSDTPAILIIPELPSDEARWWTLRTAKKDRIYIFKYKIN